MELNEARNVIDSLIAQSRLTRQEHVTLQTALGLLYDGAKENEEDKEIPVSPDA